MKNWFLKLKFRAQGFRHIDFAHEGLGCVFSSGLSGFEGYLLLGWLNNAIFLMKSKIGSVWPGGNARTGLLYQVLGIVILKVC